MNGKQRVQAAIRCEETDRTPYNFRAEAVTLEKLFRNTEYKDADQLIDALNADMRHIDAIAPLEKNIDGYYQNMWGERYVYKPSEYGPVREDMPGALSGAESFSELKDFDWPNNDSIDHSLIPGLCDKYSECAIMYGSGDVWQRPFLVRGLDNFFLDMMERPEWCHYLCDVFTEFYVEDYRRAQKASGGKIDLFLIYSDLGSQRAPLLSNAMLDEFVLPYIRRIADAIHELGASFFFHTCGMIRPFIDELIGAGVDILDPIQPCTPEMQPEALASEFGGKVCFHGGVDIQSVLINGSPQDVRREVDRYKAAFPRGYICAPSHLFQADTPVENILAMYDEIRRKAV